jgi:FixJ family two-component response regulator
MKTILIIDDDHGVCEDLEDRIAAMGYQSESVHCLEHALAALGKSDTSIDLILLDLEIPVKPEGPTRRQTGLTLLERLVAEAGTPPIIVITSHGKGQHNLCRDVMQQGAKGFISKPFDEDPPEEQIKRVLANGTSEPTPSNGTLRTFQGGELVVHESQFELIGIDIGGSRSGTIIRRVITALAPKPGAKAKRMSAKDLSDALGNIGGPSVTSAINDFRTQCVDKMRVAGVECQKDDIIETPPGNGYRMKAWITVREGLGEQVQSQVESDAHQILKLFSAHQTRTRRQIGDGVDFPSLRVKAALARLTESKRLKHVSGSGATTTYELVGAL